MTYFKVELHQKALHASTSVPGLFMPGQVMPGESNHSPRIYIIAKVGNVPVTVEEQGTTVGIEAYFYNDQGLLYTPSDGNAYVYVRDPTGTVVANYLTMTARAIGTFYYEISTTDTSPIGTWFVAVRGLNNSGTYLRNTSTFLLESVN